MQLVLIIETYCPNGFVKNPLFWQLIGFFTLLYLFFLTLISLIVLTTATACEPLGSDVLLRIILLKVSSAVLTQGQTTVYIYKIKDIVIS